MHVPAHQPAEMKHAQENPYTCRDEPTIKQAERQGQLRSIRVGNYEGAPALE